MSRVERYVFGPIDAVRPWLLLRGLLLVLAFDCWLDLVPHGGRYGFGGFNVAHFALLDRLLPVPSAGTYVGTVLLTGLLAFVMAVTRPTRVGLAGVCALYSYGWLMSMLDSYQHHYLLTLLLLSLTFFPPLTSREVFAATRLDRGRAWGGALAIFGLLELVLGAAQVDSPLSALLTDGAAVGTPGWLWATRVGLLLLGGLLAFLPEPTASGAAATSPPSSSRSRERSRSRKRSRSHERARSASRKVARRATETDGASTTVSAWAYTSFCLTCAIVYFYTAVTKLSDDWREGHALRRLARTDSLEALVARAVGEGLPVLGRMSVEEFFELLATGAILVQIVTCAGYLLAPTLDRRWPTWGRWQRALHVCVFLGAPLSFHLAAEAGLGLDIGWFSFYMIFVALVVFTPAAVLRTSTWLPSSPARWLAAKVADLPAPRRRALAAGSVLGAALAVVAAGITLDLPGAVAAGVVAALALVAASAWAWRRQRWAAAGAWGASLCAAALLMSGAIVRSDVRFDFYRFVGGEHRRHGQYALALSAYEKANAYVVRPYCVYRGTGRRAELVECYAEEARAESVAARRRGLSVRRRDRSRQEEEMRRRLQAEGVDGQ